MNLNCYGYGPPDRKWIIVDLRRAASADRPDARRRRDDARPALPRGTTREPRRHRADPRPRGPSRRGRASLAAAARCRSTPRRSPLGSLRNKLEKPGSMTEVPVTDPARRQVRARAVRARLHLHHALDPRAERARDPHAAGHGRSTPATGRSIPSRCSASRPTMRRCAQLGEKACSPASAIPPTCFVEGEAGSEARCETALETIVIGTLKRPRRGHRVRVQRRAAEIGRARRARTPAARSCSSAARCTAWSRRRRTPATCTTFPRHLARTRPRDLPRDQRPLSLHRQPGRAARGARRASPSANIPTSRSARATR